MITLESEETHRPEGILGVVNIEIEITAKSWGTSRREGVRVNREEGLGQGLKEHRHLKVRLRGMTPAFKQPSITRASIIY